MIIPQFSDIAGFGGLLRCTVAGMTYVVVRKYHPVTAMRQIEKERITILNGGRFTPDGNLQIVGRIKDMIIVHGYNVYPAEVETQLRAGGLLAEAAVIGQPGRLSGEECVAFIVPRENPETARR